MFRVWNWLKRLSTPTLRAILAAMCVTREALLYALVLRVGRGGSPVRDDELASLRALGCSLDALRVAFGSLPSSEAKEAVLARIAVLT